MVAIWNHKWTALTLLPAGFSLLVVIETAVDPYPGDTAAERAGTISMFLVGGLAIIVGGVAFGGLRRELSAAPQASAQAAAI